MYSPAIGTGSVSHSERHAQGESSNQATFFAADAVREGDSDMMLFLPFFKGE